MPRVKKEQEITAYLKFVSECDVINLNTGSAIVSVCNCFLSKLLTGGRRERSEENYKNKLTSL